MSRLRLGAKSPTRYQEVSKTEREIHRQPSFQSINNNDRHAIGGELKTPFLLKEFKSPVNFPFHVAFDRQSSRLFISGHNCKIYTYHTLFGLCNIESKYERNTYC